MAEGRFHFVNVPLDGLPAEQVDKGLLQPMPHLHQLIRYLNAQIVQ
ncbi:restriction endonuclease S subunits [Zymobacter palmae]|uniref:Restriction endonuclease S subunits n=1 Tax=Zymobacter palmae TaxID=33074 RepID=A0A348HI88_9GAMM|nr:restriction endonuclease S subunits [Zymobacter palmae]